MKFILVKVIIVFSITVASTLSQSIALRQLVNTSEYIVIGFVRTFNEDKKNSYPDKAVIEVKEVLKGNLLEKNISLNNEFVMVYYDSTDVLAFLNQNKIGEFYTNSLPWGCKKLPLSSIEIYKSRIMEVQNIFSTKNKIEKKKKTIEWLLRCVENPVTRWEGMYELAPNYIFSDNDIRSVKEPEFKLKNFQRQKLWNIFISLDNINFVDVGLIDYFLLSDSPEVKKRLIQKIQEQKGLDRLLKIELHQRLNYLTKRKL